MDLNGLAIVKKIVEEHSGTITADNNDAGGAYFKIILHLLFVNAYLY